MTFSPRFLEWGLRFLANSSQKSFERNTIEVLKLAMESRREFANVSDKVTFEYRHTGKLNLYSSCESLEKAQKLSDLKNTYGAEQTILTRAEAIEREPALAHTTAILLSARCGHPMTNPEIRVCFVRV